MPWNIIVPLKKTQENIPQDIQILHSMPLFVTQEEEDIVKLI